MFSALKLQVSNPAIKLNSNPGFASTINLLRQPCGLRLPAQQAWSISAKSQYVESVSAPSSSSSEPSLSSLYTETVGSSPAPLHLSQWNLTHRHITILNVIACTTAVSATWLFFSAIPALLAFKRAAESLEKLMDVTREELPDTMAAIRLSGMEISDLTMELSDLGQEITQGVRSSTRAVRVAEERLRRLTNMAQSASLQEVTNLKTEAPGPMVAISARGIREGVVKCRAIFQIFFTLIKFSRMAFIYFARRAKR